MKKFIFLLLLAFPGILHAQFDLLLGVGFFGLTVDWSAQKLVKQMNRKIHLVYLVNNFFLMLFSWVRWRNASYDVNVFLLQFVSGTLVDCAQGVGNICNIYNNGITISWQVIAGLRS